MLAAALLLAAQTAAPAPAPPAPPPPPACATPQHRQFDFWVGSWDVYPTGANTLVAHSLIERRYNGCAIRENWMPLQGQGGGSFSAWRPGAGAGTGNWRQTWVDSSGAWVEFTGGMDGEAMVLTGPWAGVANGRDGIVRMRYSREANGAVRQFGQVSTDNGATWANSFDFTYRPAARPLTSN
jgi:hypothetical protein